jgi:hypothetical protein
MKYMLIHAVDESRLDDLPPQAGVELDDWAEEMVARGIELDGARLHLSSAATTVRAPGGEVQVTDGPFAETKEQVAGYDVIDCPDLDTAIAVAAAHPTLHVGAIEVRAFDDGMPNPEVPERVAEGKRRYVMLVCGDMRQAMAEDASSAADGGPVEPVEEGHEPGDSGESGATDESADPMGIDAWCDSVADRRIYGWSLVFPNEAVTIRRVDGRVVTTDGPFAETKEQIGGYDLLECHDLDEALAAAATHPVAAGGVLEIRPVWT